MTRSTRPLRIVIFGLSITSSWGNGHATTYRSLIKGLVDRGHDVVFYERRQPWYEANQDLRHSDLCQIELYDSIADLDTLCGDETMAADLVMVGSYVPDGQQVMGWALDHASAVTAFYDIDTPVTLASLNAGTCQYLEIDAIPELDLYLSFSGGPILDILERRFGARKAVPLYCSVDPAQYFPLTTEKPYDLGYLGTYSTDRQPKLEVLLNDTARHWRDGHFCVAGPQYPDSIDWPANVLRIDHIPPREHCLFYNSQRFTLNVTRADMVEHGFSPSVRLFEAAACGVPVISDAWNGLEQLFVPGEEILIARSSEDVLHYLREMSTAQISSIGTRARGRVLAEHTSEHRAVELEKYVEICLHPPRPEAGRECAPPRPNTATLH